MVLEELQGNKVRCPQCRKLVGGSDAVLLPSGGPPMPQPTGPVLKAMPVMHADVPVLLVKAVPNVKSGYEIGGIWASPFSAR